MGHRQGPSEPWFARTPGMGHPPRGYSTARQVGSDVEAELPILLSDEQDVQPLDHLPRVIGMLFDARATLP